MRTSVSGVEGARAAVPAIDADRTRVRQVLLNLLSNAVKYTPEHGTVNVVVRVLATSVVASVEDSGQGLTTAQLQRLFQPFERVGAERSNVEGTGIGLYLSRRLILAMNGEMGVESQPEVGSTFWFSLPIADGAAEVDSRHSDQGHGVRDAPSKAVDSGKRALVICVDDNAVNLSVLEAMLGQIGQVEVLGVTDPVQGLELVERLRPELLFLDIRMPQIDGFEFYRRIKASPAHSGLRIVAVSADAQPADIEMATNFGFFGYLTKPIAMEQLSQVVARALEGRELAK